MRLDEIPSYSFSRSRIFQRGVLTPRREKSNAQSCRISSALNCLRPAAAEMPGPGRLGRQSSRHGGSRSFSRWRRTGRISLARYRSELGKGIARRCQRRAREPRILVHSAHEVLDAVEFELGPDPIDEGDVDDLAVKITGKIEQEGFEQHRALVEHRPPSEARDAVVAALAHAHAHRVDAVLETAGGVETQIGGGIAELAAALVAVHDRGADEPGIAEKLVGFRHPAGGEGCAY